MRNFVRRYVQKGPNIHNRIFLLKSFYVFNTEVVPPPFKSFTKAEKFFEKPKQWL